MTQKKRKMSYLLHFLLLSFISCIVNGDQHYAMDMDECRVTPNALLIAINSSADNNLTELVPNCLEYSDNSSSLSYGVLSYRRIDGTSGRYIISCNNGLLLLRTSSLSFRDNISSCYECHRDDTMNDPCVQGTECTTPYCQHCLESQQCIHCTYAMYNGVCQSSANCPNGGHPNASNGNLCECPGYFGGPTCSDCQLRYCQNTTLHLDNNTCTCNSSCQSGVAILIDPYSTVPASVIGTPGGGEESGSESTGHGRKRATDHSNGESTTTTGGSHGNETEPTICVERCDLNGRTRWRPDSNRICYACGITYCLECETNHDSCLLCRDGTLRMKENNDYICAGFYSVISHLSVELEEEEQHERELLDKEKLELKILLPIICFLTLVVYVAFGVIAHYRYPHIGHEKRHRDPKKKVTSTENTIENKFRPQSTVRFR